MRIRDIMSPSPITVTPETSLQEAVSLMQLHRIRHLPVLERGDVVSVLTDDDLIAVVPQDGGPARSLAGRHVRELASTPVVTVTPDEKLPRAANLMRERRIGCLPVVDGGSLVGIVTTADMLAHMGRHTR